MADEAASPDREEFVVSCDAAGCPHEATISPAPPPGKQPFPPPWLPAGWRAERLPIIQGLPSANEELSISEVVGLAPDGFVRRRRTIAVTFCPTCAVGDPRILFSAYRHEVDS